MTDTRKTTPSDSASLKPEANDTSEPEDTFDLELDTQGLYCPEPVMMLHSAIDSAKPMQIVKVIATDPATLRDIPKFCEFLGHRLQQHHQANDLYFYYVEKGE